MSKQYDDPGVMVRLDQALRDSDWSTAESLRDEIAHVRPLHPSSAIATAKVALARGDGECGLATCSDALRSWPENRGLLRLRILSLCLLAQYDRAESEAMHLVDRDHGSLALEMLARIAAAQGQWIRAARYWRRLSISATSSQYAGSPAPQWAINEINAWARGGQLARALLVCQQARAVGDGPVLMRREAELLFADGKLNEARAVLEEMSLQHPDANRGRVEESILIEEGRFKDAAIARLRASSRDDRVGDSQPSTRFPRDLRVPDPVGSGNDFSAIERTANQRRIEHATPTLRVAVLIRVDDEVDVLKELLQALANQTYPRELIEVLVLDSGQNKDVRSKVGETNGELGAIRHVRREKVDLVTDVKVFGLLSTTSDYFVILQSQEVPPPNLIEECMHYHHASEKAVLMRGFLLEASEGPDDCAKGVLVNDNNILSFSRSALSTNQEDREPHDASNTCDPSLACSLCNAGCYFIPFPSSSLSNSEQVSPVHLSVRIPASRRNPPGISILVPAHNCVDFIERAIASALAQTYSTLSVLVCDDGSTDGTAEKVEDVFGSDQRVTLVRQSHRGASAALNRLARLCRTPYFGQLDGDDELAPHAVEVMLNALESYPLAGMAYSRFEFIDAEGRKYGVGPCSRYSREKLLENMIATAFRVWRRRDWMRTDGFDEGIESAIDYDMALRMSVVSELVCVPEVTYRYRWHGANTSIAGRRIQEQNHHHVVNQALRRWGLDHCWSAISVNPENARDISFIRRLPGI